jgi:transmembrane sensor
MTDADWNLLLDRYAAGECSPAEIDALEQALGKRAPTADEARALLAVLRAERSQGDAVWRALDHALQQETGTAGEELERATARLTREIAARGAQFEIGDPKAARRTAARRRLQLHVFRLGGRERGLLATQGGSRRIAEWALAASVVIALAGAVRVGVIRHAAAAGAREFVTAPGQRLSVALIDGTRVTLAPASRLMVPGGYASGDRSVRLEGEGYFAVVHDAAHPFAVRARGVETRDVGTTFDVRAYPEDAGTRVAVAEGAVSVDNVPARAGDVATVVAGRVALAHRGDVSDYLAWVQGALVFDGTPLRDAVREIARAYDLDITLADSGLADRTITARIGNEPVDDVLEAVTRVVGATWERRGRTVIVRRQLPGAAPIARRALTTTQGIATQ